MATTDPTIPTDSPNQSDGNQPAEAAIITGTPPIVEVPSPAVIDPPQGPPPPATMGPVIPAAETTPNVVPVQTGVSLHLSSGEVIRATFDGENDTMAGLLGAGKEFVELKHPDGSQTLTINPAHVVYFYE